MEFRRIEYFLVLAEKLNYAQAARELCISSQALTKQINLLEEELGTRLFNRTTRHVELTEDGVMCKNRFSNLKAHYDQTIAAVREAIAKKGRRVKIGFFTPLPRNEFINRIISALVTEFEDIDFEIVTDNMDGLREKLKSGTIDLVFTNAHDFEDWSGCSHIFFKKMPAHIIVSPKHRWVKEGKTEITAKDMEDDNIILLIKHGPYEFNSFYGRVKTRSRVMVPDFDTLLMELQKGKGFSVFPMAFNDMQNTRVVEYDLPEEFAFSYRTMCSYSNSNKNPDVKKIFSFVREHKEQFTS